MKTLIVDDNEIALLALRNLVKEVPSLSLVGACTSAAEAFNFLQEQSVDLAFLDVEMPGMTGLELIKALKNAPLFILVTSKTDYALDGFDLQVADYILKPVTMPRFLTAVQHAKELFELRSAIRFSDDDKQGKPSFMFVRVNNQLIRVDFSDILYVQALGDYVLIFVPGKKHAVHLTMKSIEDRLPSEHFARVHRSYIVAFDKVSSLEENSILINKDVIPLSESHRASFLKKMNTL